MPLHSALPLSMSSMPIGGEPQLWLPAVGPGQLCMGVPMRGLGQPLASRAVWEGPVALLIKAALA